MLLQAYDFVHLNKEYGCELQIGGSDQWGNVTAGIDLGRRMLSAQLYGMTCPLLTKSDGSKMGKTETGAIWLSAERTSPYQFYQYWIRVEDADVSKCLRFLTELSHEEITALDAAREEAPHQRDSQKKLAEQLTLLIHGQAGLDQATQATEIFFGAEIENLKDADLMQIFADVPNSSFSMDQLSGEGLGLIDALVAAGLQKSKGDARRMIKQGSIYVNNRRNDNLEHRLTATDLASESTIILRSGKKNYAVLKFAD